MTSHFAKKHLFSLELTSAQRSALKAKAHALRPVVQLGQAGLSDTVTAEIANALQAHELIKVQLPGQTDATTKASETDALMAALPEHAHLIGRIGRAVILYLEKDPETALITLRSLRA